MSAGAQLDLLRREYLQIIKKAATGYLALGGDSSFDQYAPLDFYDGTSSEWQIPEAALPRTLQRSGQLELIEEQFQRIVSDGVQGDLIEAGVWRGGAIILMAALLRAYGVTDRTVIAADSFSGIPQSTRFAHDQVNKWRDRWEAGFDDVEQAIARFGLRDDRVELLRGLFADTLPTLCDRRLSMIRLDADSFDSTDTALTHLYPRLSRGGVTIIDDWHLIGCRIAVDDFRRRHKLAGELQVTAGNAWWIKQEGVGFPEIPLP